MDPVAATPTEHRHYASAMGGYAVLAGSVALLASRRREDPAPGSPGELALYGVATAGLARLVSQEKVTEWLRAPFVDESDRRPRGEGSQYLVGELLTCTRCLGSWGALVLVGARAVAPRQARVGASLLALTYLNDLLQAQLTEVQEEANAAAAAT